jgi:hypothetical protein
MIPDAYKEFIDKVINKTNNDEVKWERSTDKIFVLRTSSATVEIGHYIDPDAEVSYYYFKYYNIVTKKDAGFRVNHLEFGFGTMEELYTVASASASEIKDELSAFLNDL